jgi:predicted metal-dependent phosphoesterase TrpH
LKKSRAKAGGEEILSRPHFAQVLVEKGYAQSRQDAFTLYLAEGPLAMFQEILFRMRSA